MDKVKGFQALKLQRLKPPLKKPETSGLKPRPPKKLEQSKEPPVRDATAT